MTNKVFWLAGVFAGISSLFLSCERADTAPSNEPFLVSLPAHFPKPAYTFEQNLLTKEKFELGRMLFYDPMLSRDGSISCGNCHKQAAAFADIDHRVSHGVDDQNGTRNTPPIFNTLWQEDFFWDGGVNHLEVLPLSPITNPLEMDETIENVIAKLNGSDKYGTKFKAVFEKTPIDSQQMLKALAGFMGAMVSADSRYDQYVQGKEEALTGEEKQGLQVFEQKCASCHKQPLFTDGSFRNNGLDTASAKDEGRSLITHQQGDQGKFRVPTLRNISLTSPYMHDGRFKTLGQVLNHYSQGVKDSPTLDTALSTDGKIGIALSEEEKAALVTFLQSLTDQSFTKDAKFSEIRP
jgi:cytochrome c peroxidase